MRTYVLSRPVDGQDTWRDQKRYLWMLGPSIVLVEVPLVEHVAGATTPTPPDEVMEALDEDRYYRWITYAFLPLRYGGLVLGMWFGLALTLGSVAGIGINATSWSTRRSSASPPLTTRRRAGWARASTRVLAACSAGR